MHFHNANDFLYLYDWNNKLHLNIPLNDMIQNANIFYYHCHHYHLFRVFSLLTCLNNSNLIFFGNKIVFQHYPYVSICLLFWQLSYHYQTSSGWTVGNYCDFALRNSLSIVQMSMTFKYFSIIVSLFISSCLIF